MEDRSLSLKEIIDRIETLFGYSIEETDVKFTEYGMKSMISDVFFNQSKLIQTLRHETGCGLYEAKESLSLCNYDIEVAKEYLRLNSQAVKRYKVLEKSGEKIPFETEDYVELAKKQVWLKNDLK